MGTLAETLDLALDGDMQAHAPEVSGVLAVAQRLRRRLTTRRGTKPWWPQYGTDLRQYLLSKVPPWRIVQDAKAEIAKDEQVDAVDAAVEVLDGGRRLRLVVAAASSAARNFQFTMDITQAAGTLVALRATT
jgi:phage baseplate assembly protein W